MEKIQSAIAKARATRTATPGATAAPATATIPQEIVSPVDEAWSALPKLTADMRRLEKNRIVALSGGQEAIGIDMLRTKVLQQMRTNNWRRLAITSPTSGCGKSTIALNLAFSLSRQRELRSVLCELDLRRPSLARLLEIDAQHSMARVLEGNASFGDNAVRYNDNLAISTNAGVHRNPAELLQSAAMDRALSQIEETYQPDVMIFDMPPMLVSDDAMAFFPKVDAVILVAAAESTKIKEIDSCERDIASQTNVMGVILNKCRYMGPEYGYNYYE